MSERELQWKLKLEGIEESVRSLKALEERVKAVEGAQRTYNRQTKEQAKQTATLQEQAKGLVKQYGGFSNALGNVGNALSRVSPQIGGLTSSLASAGGAVGGLTSAFGPLGVAIGATVAVFGVVTSAMAAYDREVAGLARANIRAARSFDEVLESMRKVSAQRALQARLDAGAGSAEEHAAQATTIGERIGFLRAQAGAIAERRMRGAVLSREEAIQESALRREAAQLREEMRRQAGFAAENEQSDAQSTIDEAELATRERRRGGGGGDAAARRQRQRDIDQLRSDANVGRSGFGAGEEISVKESSGLQAGDFDRSGGIALADRKREELSLNQDIADAGVKAAEEVNAAWTDALGSIGDLFGEVYERAISGEMSFGQALKEGTQVWLRQFAIQQGRKALDATAEGIGLAFLNPPAAGAKFAQAAIHAGLALGGGAISAAIGMPGGGRGGGGASAGRDRVLGGGVRDERRGGNTYVINVGTFAVGTKADVGREVRGALAEAERHDGASV